METTATSTSSNTEERMGARMKVRGSLKDKQIYPENVPGMKQQKRQTGMWGFHNQTGLTGSWLTVPSGRDSCRSNQEPFPPAVGLVLAYHLTGVREPP